MDGFRMSAFCQETEVDHGGGLGEEVTVDHLGSPDRLEACIRLYICSTVEGTYLMEVTSQPRAQAALHMRLPAS